MQRNLMLALIAAALAACQPDAQATDDGHEVQARLLQLEADLDGVDLRIAHMARQLANPSPALKGEQGEPGPAGRDGRPGADGRDGEDGEDGEDGVDGARGNDGAPQDKGDLDVRTGAAVAVYGNGVAEAHCADRNDIAIGGRCDTHGACAGVSLVASGTKGNAASMFPAFAGFDCVYAAEVASNACQAQATVDCIRVNRAR